MSNVILSTSVTRAKLPELWEVCPIESICSRVTSGGTPSRKEPSYYEGGSILWAKSSELKDWYVYETLEKITQSGLESSSAKLLPKDTVLLALYGDGRTITSLGLLAKQATCNQACCAMICDSDKCEPRFLLYSLKHHRSELIGLASGASQRNLSGKILKQFPIAVPPLPTQRKIASILSAYDDLIENNTRRIAILEEIAQAIYREWFVNFRFPGHENVKLVDSPLGQIPEGWEVVTLKEMYPTSSGGTPSRKKEEYYNGGTINWVKTKELKDRFLWETEEKITELGLKKSSAKVYPPNTVIMAMYGATIGQLGILGCEAAVNQACCAFRVHDSEFGYPFIFLYCLCNRTDIIGLRSGAAQQNVSQDVIREIELARPPVDLVGQFNDIVSPTLQQMFTLQKATANLRKTRDLLLPKLISGKLDVEDLDIDVGITIQALKEATA